MRAIGYRTPSPIDAPDALVDIDLPDPVPGARDLLVEVKAIAVNPVDYKIRRGTLPPEGSEWRVLGWDAAGIVRSVGTEVTLFAPGDEVFYAGALGRPGTNAQLHIVDERLVGRKPETLGWAEAAALPLTAVTAWEALFDRIDVRRPVPGAANALLIVGAAGGVGSIAVQLARQLTDLTVIGTASRPETQAWAEALGAHHVIDHARGLADGVAALGIGAPAFAFSTTHTDQHFADLVALIAPQGRILLIDDPKTLDVMALKRKSVSLHHELMFTRSAFETPDMGEQGRLLNEVARLVDAGTLRTTLGEHGGRIDAANLIRAHRTLEAGTARGKIVLEGFAG